MKKAFRILFVLICFCSVNAHAQNDSIKISTEQELMADVAQHVCKNKERQQSVVDLFKRLGVAEKDIEIKKYKNKVTNVLVTKKGKADEKIVVGAHYDLIQSGCGVVDNWTGIVIIAHLYKTLLQMDTEKTYVFAAFGEEEKGLLGSQAMVKEIPKTDRESYCSMLNFDSFGSVAPWAFKNISTTKMMDLAEESAKAIGLDLIRHSIDGASSDSVSFNNAKIPSITFTGLGNDWFQIIHSKNDKLENVNSVSVYYAYRIGLMTLSNLEKLPCSSMRE